MALLQGKWIGQRGVSLKGALYVREWRGKLIICKWPEKKGRNLNPKTRVQMEWFKNANLLAKYLIPQQQIIAREASSDTPLLPRDLLIAAMAGRLWSIVLEGGGQINSVAAASDVSTNLDIIAQTPGDMLVRGDDVWERLFGPAGYIIISNGPTAAPQYKAGRDGVRLKKTVGQNYTGGTFAALTWDQALFDDNAFWSAGNSNRITVPAGVARMSFTAGVRSATVATGTVLAVIRDQAGTQIVRTQERGTSDSISLNVATGSIAVTPGDWYEVAFFTAVFRRVDENLMTFFAAEVTRAI